MESLKIRVAERSDCHSIHKLIKQLAEAKGNDVRIAVTDVEKQGFDNDPPLFSGIVAEVEEDEDGKRHPHPKVVGVALYHRKYSTWEGSVMHLNTFIVSEKFRRKGIGSQLLRKLASIAQATKYSRISFEILKSNEAASKFFEKAGALNLTKEEGWFNYYFSPATVQELVDKKAKNGDNDKGVMVRPTEPKDCSNIRDMIQELAEFEKMPDGPKLSVKDLQRDGFYKLHPDFHSFVAEMKDAESDEIEMVGYCIFFLTFNPLCGKTLHLEDVYVSPKHRGKGVGAALLNEVAKFVNEKGCKGFTLEVLNWNTKAIEFYDKFGGENVTETQGKESIRFRQGEIDKFASQ